MPNPPLPEVTVPIQSLQSMKKSHRNSEIPIISYQLGPPPATTTNLHDAVVVGVGGVGMGDLRRSNVEGFQCGTPRFFQSFPRFLSHAVMQLMIFHKFPWTLLSNFFQSHEALPPTGKQPKQKVSTIGSHFLTMSTMVSMITWRIFCVNHGFRSKKHGQNIVGFCQPCQPLGLLIYKFNTKIKIKRKHPMIIPCANMEGAL